MPFFVLDRRYGVSGAQPADVLLQVLRKAWAYAHPGPVVDAGGTGQTCPDDDSCAV